MSQSSYQARIRYGSRTNAVPCGEFFARAVSGGDQFRKNVNVRNAEGAASKAGPWASATNDDQILELVTNGLQICHG